MTNYMSPKTLGRFDRLDPAKPLRRGRRGAFSGGFSGLDAVHGQETDDVDLIAVARTLWRGKVWIAAAAILCATAAWLWVTRVATPLYTASATVVLEPSPASVVDLASVVSGLGSDQLSINTEAEVLTSRGLMAQLVDRLDLTADPAFNPWAPGGVNAAEGGAPPSADVQRDVALARVNEAVSVSNVKSSYVFRITAVTTEPRRSAMLATALAETYVADRLQVKFDATEAATGWLTERVAELKRELEASDTALQVFIAGTELVSPEALAALGRQLKDNRARRADLDAERIAATAALNGPGADRLSATARARLEAERNAAEARITALENAAEGMAAAFERQSADLIRLEQMRRESEASRALYEYFLTRLKETAVQQGIQQPDARVLSAAPVPRLPSSPRITRTMVAALILGGLIGAAILVLREIMHTGYRTADALEAETGHVVYGQIPQIPARTRAEVLEHLIENPAGPASEAVRNLRTSLMLSNVDRPPKVILSTSSMPGDGKTTLAVALARNFATLGRRVLLIEGDMRSRVFSEYVDLAPSRGLGAVLAGETSFEAVVQHAPKLGADVLTGGASPANAADLYASQRFATLIEGLRARYDIVVIDMPPVLLVPDARIAAQHADAILFSVKWDCTSRAQLTEAIREFEIAGSAITGLVLTQIDPKGMKKYGYTGKYGAYRSYGQTGYGKPTVQG